MGYCQAQDDGTRGHDRKLQGPCTLCHGSTKKGHLWLGGSDYVQCPDCMGTGVVTFIETLVNPKRHFAVQGLRRI
jgi:DnaJ-class molecular chaperone